MDIYESGENYLETILLLKNKNNTVRSVDIAHELGFSKPSISRAMGVLRKLGYIEISEQGFILLTPKGQLKAESVYSRHTLIKDFLTIHLGVNKETAAADACKIEHFLSDEVIEAMKKKLM